VSRGRLEAALWVLTLLLLLLGWSRWRRAVPEATPRETAAERAAPEVIRPPRGRLSTAARVVAAGDPFRLDRVPAPIGSQPPGMPGMPSGIMPGMMPPPFVPPRPPSPALLVSGIVGPPWQAVLEGVPGQQGAVVVRAGTVLGDLRVRSVTRDRVVVAGPDTTWNLSVRKPWQP
jgi:hypothetical protein